MSTFIKISADFRMTVHRRSLGPELRHLLADADGTLAGLCQHELEDTLTACLQRRKPRHLIALVAELIDLRLPLSALQLLGTQAREQADDFTLSFWQGAANMAEGDWLAAKKNFYAAHCLRPDEIAVHDNLAAILRAEGNTQAAQQWLRAGLQIDSNAVQLWSATHRLCSAKTLLALAEELQAWRGASLYAQLTGDLTAALAIYRRVFAGGERSGEFLIEFSGALGRQGCYAELGALAWQVLGQGSWPWQVYEHFAQAFTRLNNQRQAQRCTTLAQNARAHSYTP